MQESTDFRMAKSKRAKASFMRVSHPWIWRGFLYRSKEGGLGTGGRRSRHCRHQRGITDSFEEMRRRLLPVRIPRRQRPARKIDGY